MSLSPMPDLHSQAVEHSHKVQFYSNDTQLVDEICQVLGKALASRQSVIVIGTLDHCKKITKNLEVSVPELPKAIARGRYIALDAAEMLSRFMVGDAPDPQRFANIVGNVIMRAEANANPKDGACKVVAFGEMVAVLCAEGKEDAALKVEELWDHLATRHSFFLYRAYPIQAFRNSSDPDVFLQICGVHAGVVGGDDTRIMEKKADSFAAKRDTTLEKEGRWQEIENRFRLFVESVLDYAIFMLDPKGNVTSWSRGAKRIKGYEASEIIGKNFSVFYPEEDVRARKPEMELEVAAREGRFEDEGWRLRNDGSRFWANVIITAVRDEAGRLIGFGKVTRDFTEKMQAQRALDRVNHELRKEALDRRLAEQRAADSERSLRSLSLHLLRTQDEERKRIGRDLHDSLGQVLTAMKISLATLKAATPENQAAISKCLQFADDCIREVRTISYLLYPPMLEELGLKSAISWYLDGFAERSGIKTAFECSPDFDRLPREMELALFRVLQEALTNVHRHSESLVAQVRLLVEGGNAVLEVQDAGKGIPAEVLGEPGELPRIGVGLRGMNERIRQMRGRLEVSANTKGTTLTAIVPIEAPVREPVSAVSVSV